MSRTKKLALSAAVVLAGLAMLGAGTFATFNAEASNAGNTFATGTIVLSNTVGTGNACLSTAGGNTNTNANPNCDALFNLAVQKPGATGQADLVIKNDGSLDASSFGLYSSLCTAGNASNENYHGTGDPCGELQLTVQQWSDASHTTPVACVYGGGTGATCQFAGTKTLADFATNHGSSNSAVAIGSGLAAGTSEYFTVSVQLPSSAGNQFQGRQASIDFSWLAQQ